MFGNDGAFQWPVCGGQFARISQFSFYFWSVGRSGVLTLDCLFFCASFCTSFVCSSFALLCRFISLLRAVLFLLALPSIARTQCFFLEGDSVGEALQVFVSSWFRVRVVLS